MKLRETFSGHYILPLNFLLYEYVFNTTENEAREDAVKLYLQFGCPTAAKLVFSVRNAAIDNVAFENIIHKL